MKSIKKTTDKIAGHVTKPIFYATPEVESLNILHSPSTLL